MSTGCQHLLFVTHATVPTRSETPTNGTGR